MPRARPTTWCRGPSAGTVERCCEHACQVLPTALAPSGAAPLNEDRPGTEPRATRGFTTLSPQLRTVTSDRPQQDPAPVRPVSQPAHDGGGDRSDQQRDRERPLRVGQRHVVHVGDGVGNVTFARSADGSRYYAVNRSPEKLNAGDETVLDGIYVSPGPATRSVPGPGSPTPTPWPPPAPPWTRRAARLPQPARAAVSESAQAPPRRFGGGLVRKCPSHRICSTVDVITGRRLRWRLPSPRWAARRRSVVRPGRRRRRRDVPHWRWPRRTARTRKARRCRRERWGARKGPGRPSAARPATGAQPLVGPSHRPP